MGHYKSNLRDIEFNLFEVFKAGDRLGQGPFADMDVDTAKFILAESEKLDNFEFVRTIAAARITMPRSYVRLSAGRESMSEELQTLCFLAGANSIFYCDKLLTTMNAGTNRDVAMFEKLGLKAV